MKSSKDWTWKLADEDSVSLAETVFEAEFSITCTFTAETYIFNIHIRDLSHADNSGTTTRYAVCYWEPMERTEIWLEEIDICETQAEVFGCIDRCVAVILEDLAKKLRGVV